MAVYGTLKNCSTNLGYLILENYCVPRFQLFGLNLKCTVNDEDNGVSVSYNQLPRCRAKRTMLCSSLLFKRHNPWYASPSIFFFTFQRIRSFALHPSVFLRVFTMAHLQYGYKDHDTSSNPIDPRPTFRYNLSRAPGAHTSVQTQRAEANQLRPRHLSDERLLNTLQPRIISKMPDIYRSPYCRETGSSGLEKTPERNPSRQTQRPSSNQPSLTHNFFLEFLVQSEDDSKSFPQLAPASEIDHKPKESVSEEKDDRDIEKVLSLLRDTSFETCSRPRHGLPFHVRPYDRNELDRIMSSALDNTYSRSTGRSQEDRNAGMYPESHGSLQVFSKNYSSPYSSVTEPSNDGSYSVPTLSPKVQTGPFSISKMVSRQNRCDSPFSRAKRKNPLYKTELCRQFAIDQTCRYGRKCQFAHGEHEKREPELHPQYKTKMCMNYQRDGHCRYGLLCNFIHGPNDPLQYLHNQNAQQEPRIDEPLPQFKWSSPFEKQL